MVIIYYFALFKLNANRNKFCAHKNYNYFVVRYLNTKLN